MKKLITFVLVLAFALSFGATAILAGGDQNAGEVGDGEIVQNGPCPHIGF